MPKMLAAIAAMFACATAAAQGTLTFAPAHTAKAPLVFAFPGHEWSLIAAADGGVFAEVQAAMGGLRARPT